MYLSNELLCPSYTFSLFQGVEQIKNEVLDPGERLIDPLYGHGNQSLINLLMTGRAVSNVWDNDKDLSGLSECNHTYSIQTLVRTQ